MERANEWLYKNPDVQMRCCETITWMSHDAKRLEDGEHMVLTQSIEDNGSTSCMRGFRYSFYATVSYIKTYTQVLLLQMIQFVAMTIKSMSHFLNPYHNYDKT